MKNRMIKCLEIPQKIRFKESIKWPITENSSKCVIFKDIKDQIEEIRQLNLNQFSEIRTNIENNKVQHQQQSREQLLFIVLYVE